MIRRILFNPDGSLSQIIPAINSKKSSESYESWLNRVFDKSNPKKYDYKDFDEKDLPKESIRFWKYDVETGQISIDMDKKLGDEKFINDEKLIQEKIRVLAIESLKSEGKLEQSFKG